jgi:8-oxo-dGTP pyrophosphatase MutT (NUDIX family)
MTTAPVARRAARVLLVDAAGRVLLFRGHDPEQPDAGSWWFTVGGGLDEGESPREAAARELFEETGLVLAASAFGESVFRSTAEFALAGVRYIQEQDFFLAQVDSHEVDTVGFTELEESFVLGHHWWTREELRTTADTVYPGQLADLLDGLGV